MNEISTQERFKRGAIDAGRYFNYMAEFIGFSDEDAQTIKETRFQTQGLRNAHGRCQRLRCKGTWGHP